MQDLLPHGFADEKTPLTVGQLSAQYMQEADTPAGFDTLTISTQDNGSGTFFVLQTDRWAFDNLAELVGIVEDFMKRI